MNQFSLGWNVFSREKKHLRERKGKQAASLISLQRGSQLSTASSEPTVYCQFAAISEVKEVYQRSATLGGGAVEKGGDFLVTKKLKFLNSSLRSSFEQKQQ